jgi:hypothetical protein
LASRQTRVIDGDGTATQSVTLYPGLLQYVQAVLVEVDNGAGPAIKPTLTVATNNGQALAKQQQGRSIPAGDTGSATWALRLADEREDGVTSVVSGDPNVFTFPPGGPSVAVGRFSLSAQISRDGAAPALNVATGALAVTTTNVQHNTVNYQAGITANVVAVPSRLVIVSAGLYLIHAFSTWGNFGAADFGMCVGIVLGASAFVNPGTISRRVLGQVLTHEAVLMTRLNAGAIITQAVGQNSGAPIAMGIATLTAYRLGPRP